MDIYICVCVCVYIYICVCVCVCIYIYVCVCVCIYIYVYIYMCVCLYIYICVCIYIYVCVYIFIYVCVCVCLYIYVCVCVCVRVYIYIYNISKLTDLFRHAHCLRFRSPFQLQWEIWNEKCCTALFLGVLKSTGYVMHQQFNIQQLYALPTLYLCVLYLSENKQRLVPLTAQTDWFL